MYLKEGEQISVDQLLAGLIVMSANDAAVTLAERISGNVPAFETHESGSSSFGHAEYTFLQPCWRHHARSLFDFT
jgi:hypothetical protein